MLIDTDLGPVEVDRIVPIGASFKHMGRWHRRVPSLVRHGSGRSFNGGVVAWSEPLEGRGAVRAPRYNSDGFPVFRSDREIREYEARSKDTKRPVSWAK